MTGRETLRLNRSGRKWMGIFEEVESVDGVWALWMLWGARVNRDCIEWCLSLNLSSASNHV